MEGWENQFGMKIGHPAKAAAEPAEGPPSPRRSVRISPTKAPASEANARMSAAELTPAFADRSKRKKTPSSSETWDLSIDSLIEELPKAAKRQADFTEQQRKDEQARDADNKEFRMQMLEMQRQSLELFRLNQQAQAQNQAANNELLKCFLTQSRDRE
jgi:hypothetical protein